MSAPEPLLDTVHRLLARTYRIEAGLAELAPFVIGDLGYRLLYGSRPPTRWIGESACAARTLVREVGGAVHVRVYFPDALIRRLEQFPPQRGIGEPNVRAFATFVEEIDHLLLIAERARQERGVSLFELELHANVSQHLVLARFVAAADGAVGPAARGWLRRQLFDDTHDRRDEAPERARYREAVRQALRLIDALPALPPAERLPLLRRFHAADCAAKLELIDRCRAA